MGITGTYVNRVILTLGTIPLGYEILCLHMVPIKDPVALCVTHSALDWQMDWSQAEKNEDLPDEKVYVLFWARKPS